MKYVCFMEVVISFIFIHVTKQVENGIDLFNRKTLIKLVNRKLFKIYQLDLVFGLDQVGFDRCLFQERDEKGLEPKPKSLTNKI